MKFQPGNNAAKDVRIRRRKSDNKYGQPPRGTRDKKCPHLRPRFNVILDEDMINEIDHWARHNNRAFSAEIRACIRLALQVRSQANQGKLKYDSQMRTLRLARG